MQVLEFPLWSVAVTNTLLLPKCMQEKLTGKEEKDPIPQLSVGELAGGEVRITFPELFR